MITNLWIQFKSSHIALEVSLSTSLCQRESRACYDSGALLALSCRGWFCRRGSSSLRYRLVEEMAWEPCLVHWEGLGNMNDRACSRLPKSSSSICSSSWELASNRNCMCPNFSDSFRLSIKGSIGSIGSGYGLMIMSSCSSSEGRDA